MAFNLSTWIHISSPYTYVDVQGLMFKSEHLMLLEIANLHCYSRHLEIGA